MGELTHFDSNGRTRMVDVSDKSSTTRIAIARGEVHMSPETFEIAKLRETKKGDPIAIAELAGIMAAKKTADIIPLCHPLPLTKANVVITPDESRSCLVVEATVRVDGKTGVEMEALTAVSGACLTLYDMLKAVDKSMIISNIELIQKTGGKSGDYQKASS